MASSDLPKYFTNLVKSEKAMVAANLLKAAKNSTVSTGSLSLDWASGGILRGTMTLLWSPPGAGKTTLALKVMAKELQANPGKVAVWIDTEYSFDVVRAESLGVDVERVILFQSNLMEEAVAPLGKIAAEMIEDKKVCFIGLDSVKGLTSINEQNQMEEGDVSAAANAYGGIAKTVNPSLNLLLRLSHELNCVTVLTNHAMMNLDPKTSKYYPYVLTGGQKLKHLCSTVIFLQKPESKDAKLFSAEAKDMQDHDVAIGSLIRAKVTKSRRVVEGRTAEFYWNLQNGEFEKKELELFRLAKGLGVIYKPEGKARWYFGPEETGSKGTENDWVGFLSNDQKLATKVLAACQDSSKLLATSDVVAEAIETVEAETV